jgi:hypothetical protein
MKQNLVLLQMFDHPLFDQISPNAARNKFVIENPFDTGSVLYLSRKEYNQICINAIANDTPLVVLLSPGESTSRPKDDGSSGGQSSPPVSPTSVTKFSSSDGGSKRSYHTFTRHNPRSDIYSFNTVFSQSDFSMIELGQDQGLTGTTLRALIERWGEILSLRLGYRILDPFVLKSISHVGKYFEATWSHHGVVECVRRMKIAVYAINSYIAGSPLVCTRHLGGPLALRKGLPEFLPVGVRRQIRSGNVRTIRLWVSILSLYKGVKYDSQPNYSTIQTPPVPDLPLHFVEEFKYPFWEFLNPFDREVDWTRSGNRLLSLRTAGPNHPISSLSAPFDAYAWSVSKSNTLIRFLTETKQTRLIELYQECLSTFLSEDGKGSRLALRQSASSRVRASVTESPLLGRLSLKYEPAGKVRVFAIVDIFTQSALKALHMWIFDLLRGLTSDATFDQEGKVSQFARDHKRESIYSFDLSSATDLIPMALTVEIMRGFLGDLSPLWGELLVDRDYKLPDQDASIRYTRGQPIGALSSWSALAITHHWLVQQAAQRIGKFPFTEYLVLGDDISIAGKDVADSYLEVCKDFSVPINNKGITSHPEDDRDSLVNFANQILIGDINYSPVQIREEISITSMSTRVEALCRLVRKGWLDYHSPSFLSDLYRHCITSPRQLRSGLDSFSRGVLPGGYSDLLTHFLLPSPAKSWGWNKESPITYVYIRLLAGINICGGWSHFTAHPQAMEGKVADPKDLLPVYFHIITSCYDTVTRFAGQYSDSRYFIEEPSEWLRKVTEIAGSPLPFSQKGSAYSYLLANDVVLEYFRTTLLSMKDGRMEIHMNQLFLAFAEIREFMTSPDAMDIGKFLNKLYKFLLILDSYVESPRFAQGYLWDAPVKFSTKNSFPSPHDEGYYLSHIQNLPMQFDCMRPGLVPRLREAQRASIQWDVSKVDPTMRYKVFDDEAKVNRVIGRVPRSIRFLRQVLQVPSVFKPLV